MFDPLVIDDSAHLDRVLNTGHASPHTLNASLKSPLVSSSSSSDSPHQSTRRPKLSDGLRHATFSPKRPRNPQPFASPRAERSGGARNGISHSPGRVSFDIPTPRAKSHSKAHPQVKVQPPTPSNASSKFTKVAKGLARDIESERERLQYREEDVAPTPLRERTRSKGNLVLWTGFWATSNDFALSSYGPQGNRQAEPQVAHISSGCHRPHQCLGIPCPSST
jgi:hypothetical protein